MRPNVSAAFTVINKLNNSRTLPLFKFSEKSNNPDSNTRYTIWAEGNKTIESKNTYCEIHVNNPIHGTGRIAVLLDPVFSNINQDVLFYYSYGQLSEVTEDVSLYFETGLLPFKIGKLLPLNEGKMNKKDRGVTK